MRRRLPSLSASLPPSVCRSVGLSRPLGIALCVLALHPRNLMPFHRLEKFFLER